MLHLKSSLLSALSLCALSTSSLAEAPPPTRCLGVTFEASSGAPTDALRFSLEQEGPPIRYVFAEVEAEGIVSPAPVVRAHPIDGGSAVLLPFHPTRGNAAGEIQVKLKWLESLEAPLKIHACPGSHAVSLQPLPEAPAGTLEELVAALRRLFIAQGAAFGVDEATLREAPAEALPVALWGTAMALYGLDDPRNEGSLSTYLKGEGPLGERDKEGLPILASVVAHHGLSMQLTQQMLEIYNLEPAQAPPEFELIELPTRGLTTESAQPTAVDFMPRGLTLDNCASKLRHVKIDSTHALSRYMNLAEIYARRARDGDYTRVGQITTAMTLTPNLAVRAAGHGMNYALIEIKHGAEQSVGVLPTMLLNGRVKAAPKRFEAEDTGAQGSWEGFEVDAASLGWSDRQLKMDRAWWAKNLVLDLALEGGTSLAARGRVPPPPPVADKGHPFMPPYLGKWGMDWERASTKGALKLPTQPLPFNAPRGRLGKGNLGGVIPTPRPDWSSTLDTLAGRYINNDAVTGTVANYHTAHAMNQYKRFHDRKLREKLKSGGCQIPPKVWRGFDLSATNNSTTELAGDALRRGVPRAGIDPRTLTRLYRPAQAGEGVVIVRPKPSRFPPEYNASMGAAMEVVEVARVEYTLKGGLALAGETTALTAPLRGVEDRGSEWALIEAPPGVTLTAKPQEGAAEPAADLAIPEGVDPERPIVVRVRSTSNQHARKGKVESDPREAVAIFKTSRSLDIYPTAPCVEPGAVFDFDEYIDGALNREAGRARWAATGGVIDDGRFTAPAERGEVQVTATLIADPRVQDRVTVRVGGCECAWSGVLTGPAFAAFGGWTGVSAVASPQALQLQLHDAAEGDQVIVIAKRPEGFGPDWLGTTQARITIALDGQTAMPARWASDLEGEEAPARLNIYKREGPRFWATLESPMIFYGSFAQRVRGGDWQRGVAKVHLQGFLYDGAMGAIMGASNPSTRCPDS